MLLVATPARADAVGVWAAARADTFGGTSDLFAGFESRVGLGLEAGVELLYISLFGEALLMDTDQYLLTANLGLDITVGDAARLSLGAYTGPLLFVFPESPAPSGVDLSGIPAEQQQMLMTAGGWSSLDQAEAELDVFSSEEQELGRMAFGWNVIRGRVAADIRLAPTLYLGVAAQLGYHLLISGADVAAGAKNEAITNFAAQYRLEEVPGGGELVSSLRTAVGARPVDKEELDGWNYDLNVFLRLEL